MYYVNTNNTRLQHFLKYHLVKGFLHEWDIREKIVRYEQTIFIENSRWNRPTQISFPILFWTDMQNVTVLYYRLQKNAFHRLVQFFAYLKVVHEFLKGKFFTFFI
jgi:hypothetical protein